MDLGSFLFNRYFLKNKTKCEEKGHILNFKYLVSDIINSTL